MGKNLFERNLKYLVGNKCPNQDVFIGQLEVSVNKRSAIKVTVDEEWATEREMKEDLGWSAFLDIKNNVHIFTCMIAKTLYACTQNLQ